MSPKRLAQSQADMAEGKFVTQDPANVAPVTVWLCSPANTDVTGRIFSQSGSRLTVFSSFHPSDVSRKVTAELCVPPLSDSAMIVRAGRGDLEGEGAVGGWGAERCDAGAARDGGAGNRHAEPADGQRRTALTSGRRAQCRGLSFDACGRVTLEGS
eukprot:COSAG04_NODE_809_length_10142_cov_3.378174_4_plen_156_part_00